MTGKIVKILLCLGSVVIFASEPEWTDSAVFWLQKDEKKSGEIVIFDAHKNMSLHWSLHKISQKKSLGITVLLNFDGFNHHFVLFPEKNRDTFLLKIGDVRDFVSVIFKDFDEKRAKFFVGAHGKLRMSL